MALIEGEIDRFLRNVRRVIGEPDPGEWSNQEVIDAANQIADRIFFDMLLPADRGYGEYTANITFVADQEQYALPYGLVRFLWASELNTDGSLLGTHRNIFRSEREMIAGVWITDRKIGISPIPTQAQDDAYQLIYIRKPVPIHKAEAQAESATSLTLGKQAQLGQILTQSNAYLGARVQVLNADTNEGEIATVTAHVGSTGVLTVAWTNTPTGVVTYEIMPDLPLEAYDLWYLLTADQCLSDHDAGSNTRLAKLGRDIVTAKKSLRHVANTRTRTGDPPAWSDGLEIL